MSKRFSLTARFSTFRFLARFGTAAFVFAVVVGCELTIVPGDDGSDDSMDMSSNGTSTSVTPDDGTANDDTTPDEGDGSNNVDPVANAKVQIEMTAFASEQDILGQLNIDLDQVLTVTPVQAKANRHGKTQADVAPTKSGNTISVSGSLVGGIKARQVLIGAKFVEITRMPIALPIDAPVNDAIKAFTTLPPGGLSFLDEGDYMDLPDLNDLEGGILTDTETTPDLESIRAAFIDEAIKAAILGLVNDDSDGVVVGAPDVEVFSEQRTTFIHRNEFSDSTDLEGPFGDALNTTDPQVATVQSGFVLDFTPTVKDDGTIELKIYPGSRGIVFARSETEQIDNQEFFIEMPIFELSTVQTTVSVPDGGTVLLGGIKRLSEATNERGVPVLSKVPYINRLFKNNATIRDSQSLMLMVTPRIIIQEEEER